MSLTDEQIADTYNDCHRLGVSHSIDIDKFAHAIYKLGRESMREEVLKEWNSPYADGDLHIGIRLRDLQP